ncbi:UNVERIFIED_CONTAM: hypothetical protein HDU68_003093, partial [Siphonaria sp. JEL0065]
HSSYKSDTEEALLGFCAPGSPVKQVVSEQVEGRIRSQPKLEYDVSVANIIFWASYTESFKTLYTLALNNHHPSKLFFDPKTSPISAKYNDSTAAYTLGIFLKNNGLINLSARWFKVSSDGGHPGGMLEYAKVLCCPGWAYYFSQASKPPSPSTEETAITFTTPSSAALNPKIDTTKRTLTQLQQELLENSIDTSLAMSLLHHSYNLEPTAEAAFYIAMIYCTAPTRSSFVKAAMSPAVSPRIPSAKLTTNLSTPSESTNWSQIPPTSLKIHNLTVYKDFTQAATWFHHALSPLRTSPTTLNLTTHIHLLSAYNLAKIHLLSSSHENQQQAVSLLHAVAETHQSSVNAESLITTATYLLGHCMTRGIGVYGGEKKYEEGEAWFQICRVRSMSGEEESTVEEKEKEEEEEEEKKRVEYGSDDFKVEVRRLLERVSREVKKLAVGSADGSGRERQISCAPIFMLAYGVCLKFGVGSGDVCKGEFWIQRAKGVLGFGLEKDWEELLSLDPEKEEDQELAEGLKRVLCVGGFAKTRVALGANGNEVDGYSSIVSPSVPDLGIESETVGFSHQPIASLPPLPVNYTLVQKSIVAGEAKETSVYPPMQNSNDKWLLRDKVMVEEVVEGFD